MDERELGCDQFDDASFGHEVIRAVSIKSVYPVIIMKYTITRFEFPIRIPTGWGLLECPESASELGEDLGYQSGSGHRIFQERLRCRSKHTTVKDPDLVTSSRVNSAVGFFAGI